MLTSIALVVVLANAVPEDSVVRVQVYRSRADWTSPWRQMPVESGLGSGFVVEGNYVVTNAHVVRDARQVLVKRHHVADPFVATVAVEGDDCDLAVLRVEDPAFWKGMKPLKLGDLPRARSRVTTYGFPLGGEEVSSTGGIVSRIEWSPYTHSGADAHIAVQTDAAINPGNSGGPVWQDGRVVGVAFQGLPGMDNVGFFIPTLVVKHFLDDIRDGRHDGFPDGGARTSPLISPALKKERRLPAGKSGVVVQEVQVGSTFDGVVKPGDVIMAVEGIAIADDGNVPLADTRVPWGHVLDVKQVGEKFTVKVLRDGAEMTATGVMKRLARADRLRNIYNQKPRFLVHGGVVFMPLNVEFLKTLGADYRSTAPRELLWHMFFREFEKPEEAEREVVVVARVLRHPVNSQFGAQAGTVVEKVNGVPINSMADLARALDGNTGPHDVFEFGDDGERDALDRARALAAQKVIMKTYGLPRDREL